jgi:hypothetical protein
MFIIGRVRVVPVFIIGGVTNQMADYTGRPNICLSVVPVFIIGRPTTRVGTTRR